MNKLTILAAALATAVSYSAFAQTSFEGFGVQIATGYQSSSIKLEPYTDSSSEGDMPLPIGVGYTVNFGNGFALGIVGEYNPLDNKAASSGLACSGSPSCTAGTLGFDVKLKNQWDISIEPGYLLNDQNLGYLKVGYVGATAEADIGGSATINGWTAGVGDRYLFTDHAYGLLEADYNGYSNKSVDFDSSAATLKTDSYDVLVGVGYVF